MGGWNEEAWHSQLQASRCLLALGDNPGFISAAMQAFDMRPHRAEPLYELAKFHRVRGLNETAMLFCEKASGLPWPKHDTLFIEDFVYTAGIREEAAMAGRFSDFRERREAGRRACFWLATDRNAPEPSRTLARSNQTLYAPRANSLFPSFQDRLLGFASRSGGNVMNPSVAIWDGSIYVLARSVNYLITEAGSYDIPNGGSIETRNYLLQLDDDFQLLAWSGIGSRAICLHPAINWYAALKMPACSFGKVHYGRRRRFANFRTRVGVK